MESKHTPGPWDTKHTATPEWAQQSAVYAGGRERAVALVYDGEHHEANAALIAAAPDMYEALRALRDAKRESTQALRHAADRLLDAALAKAEGR